MCHVRMERTEVACKTLLYNNRDATENFIYCVDEANKPIDHSAHILSRRGTVFNCIVISFYISNLSITSLPLDEVLVLRVDTLGFFRRLRLELDFIIQEEEN